MYLLAMKDGRLLLICLLACFVSLLTSTSVASRPAAITTKRVAMAFTIANIFFMVTRLASFFYGPFFASYVDRAEQTGNLSMLIVQIRLIIFSSAIGAIFAWLLLPTLIEIYRRGIESLEHHQSMIKVVLLLLKPRAWVAIVKSFRRPSNLGVSLFRLEGVPWGFLLFNIFATAIWTVGVLCATYASALHPEYKRTAMLLSGLVNSVAAILFSMVIDPKASLITDQAIAGTRPARHVFITAVFLAAGNVLGAFLGHFFLIPGAKAIEVAILALAKTDMSGSLIVVIFFSIIVTLKASTTYAARIAAVLTRRVATAIAIYNFFFLITRIAQQIYAPIIGSLGDIAVKRHDLLTLQLQIRWVIGGCTIGALMGWILMPTFVEIYKKAIGGMEKYGSLPKLLAVTFLFPSSWLKVLSCFRAPTLFGVRLGDIRLIPRSFIVGNIVVISVHTVGVMASIYASALYPEFARTATLLSAVVNSVATIVLGIIVDPISALITDEAVAEKRPLFHVKVMAVFLTAGTLIGTILSQAIFVPAALFIKFCSIIVGRFF
jgi:hypothetical protein